MKRTILVEGMIEAEQIEAMPRSRNLQFALLVLIYFSGIITGFGLALVQ